MLNAMGSARLEIMDERDEDKEREKSPEKTATQQKVWAGYILIAKVLLLNILRKTSKFPANNKLKSELRLKCSSG